MIPFDDKFEPSKIRREDLRAPAERIVTEMQKALAVHNLFAFVSHDLHDVVRFQRRYADEMPLFELFDPECQPEHDETNTLMVFAAASQDADPVGMTGCRFFFVEGDIGDRMASQEMFFQPRALRGPKPGQGTIVEGKVDTISDDPVGMLGSAFVDPAHQGQKLFTAISRLIRVLAFQRDWKWLAALVHSEKVPGLARLYGYKHFDRGIYRPKPGYALKEREYYLCRFKRSDVATALFSEAGADVQVALGAPANNGRGGGAR